MWGTGSLANVSLDDEGNIPDSYKGIADDDIIISMADTATHTYTAKVSSKTLYNDVAALPLRTMTGPFTPTARPMSTPSTATTCMTTVPALTAS